MEPWGFNQSHFVRICGMQSTLFTRYNLTDKRTTLLTTKRNVMVHWVWLALIVKFRHSSQNCVIKQLRNLARCIADAALKLLTASANRRAAKRLIRKLWNGSQKVLKTLNNRDEWGMLSNRKTRNDYLKTVEWLAHTRQRWWLFWYIACLFECGFVIKDEI